MSDFLIQLNVMMGILAALVPEAIQVFASIVLLAGLAFGRVPLPGLLGIAGLVGRRGRRNPMDWWKIFTGGDRRTPKSITSRASPNPLSAKL